MTKTIEVTVLDKSRKKVPGVRINSSYGSMFDAVASRVGKEYKVNSGKTDTNGKCRFHANKDLYIWFGVVSRDKGNSIKVDFDKINTFHAVTLTLDKNIEEYKVQHSFQFVDRNKKAIPASGKDNQLLYRISTDYKKTWSEYKPLTNPLNIPSHVGQDVFVKLYTAQDRYDVLAETGKNEYSAYKRENLGLNELKNVMVPIAYVDTKTGQNKPMTTKQEEKYNNKCLSGFENCPCQTLKFNDDGFMDNPMVDTTDRIPQAAALQPPVAIVLHRTHGWTAKTSINSGREDKAVAHFYVCSGLNGKNADGSFKKVPTDGKIYQVLPTTKQGGHMGRGQFSATKAAKIGNHNTLSIEVSGRYDGDARQWPPVSDKQARSVACLLTALMRKYKLGYDKVYFHEDLCSKMEYEGRLVWISIKKYLNKPPKGPKPAPYRPAKLPFQKLDIYPEEN